MNTLAIIHTIVLLCVSLFCRRFSLPKKIWKLWFYGTISSLALWNCKVRLLSYFESSLFSDKDQFLIKIQYFCLYLISELSKLTNLEILDVGANQFYGLEIPVKGDPWLSIWITGHFAWAKCLFKIRGENNYCYYSQHSNFFLQLFVTWRICGSSVLLEIIL